MRLARLAPALAGAALALGISTAAAARLGARWTAAERETLEEVGLALSDPHWIGPLSDVPVRIGGTGVPLS